MMNLSRLKLREEKRERGRSKLDLVGQIKREVGVRTYKEGKRRAFVEKVGDGYTDKISLFKDLKILFE
ncbi:jg12208 [Pararge aegeria aegeria]|uniref:Jg12208 protein n=1 Tax=Pararge aegeria aegeria TaxID=348720 RepID=A0A8S4QHW9_9NEOP|nr:jg12208 [Pararge aegeria aegeria]